MRNHLVILFISCLTYFGLLYYFDNPSWEMLYFLGYDTLGYSCSDSLKMLFIGIMSSPDHFRQRQSLRKTWLTLLPDPFQYKFVVGKESCKIHHLDRKSLYTCEDLNLEIPENFSAENLLHANNIKLPDSCDDALGKNIGFSFQVHYPIVIKHLGLKRISDTLNKNVSTTVVLVDLRTSEEITSVIFDHNSITKELAKKDYVFKRLITPVLLPKGFEGVVKVKGMTEHIQRESYEDSTDWTHGNFLSVFNTITQNPNQFPTNYCGYSTFTFSVRDIDGLNSFLKKKQSRLLEWLEHVEETRVQLQLEAKQYKDIIFVDLVDVYRNLPKKLLSLIEWSYNSARAKYLLKTDDDTFIDIKRVEAELSRASGWDWWSCFRVGWPVQRYGKWRETEYQHQVYPTFPSGGGYVVSDNVVRWLSDRMENLTTGYQGEDVALGIWLESMNASRHTGSECYWACNNQCHPNTCNVVDLSVDQVYKMWNEFQNCGYNICRCPGLT